MKSKNMSIFTSGIIKENPVLRLMLGTCPTLAVTTAAINGVGMGVAATIVLVCSNLVISLLRNFIPDKVRIPAFITVIAGFVSVYPVSRRGAWRIFTAYSCKLYHFGSR